MPLIAAVKVTKLAGPFIPAPVLITMTVVDADTDALTDISSPDIRRRDPDGRLATLDWQRTAAGTYVVGSQVAPLVLSRGGKWNFEGRSSDVTELVTQSVEEVELYSNGFPVTAVPSISSGEQPVKVTSHRVTQAEIDANAPVYVALPFIPTAAIATISGGTGVSNLVSHDGVNARVALAMSDGVNPSPFVDGDIVVITALQ